LVPASFELSMLLDDGSGEVVSVAVKASWIAMAMSTSLHSVPVQGFRIVECGLRASRLQPECGDASCEARGCFVEYSVQFLDGFGSCLL